MTAKLIQAVIIIRNYSTSYKSNIISTYKVTKIRWKKTKTDNIVMTSCIMGTLMPVDKQLLVSEHQYF